MSDLSDLPRPPPTTAIERGELETLALSLARVERQLGELAVHLAHQQNSLARTRKELITILWPRDHATTKGTT